MYGRVLQLYLTKEEKLYPPNHHPKMKKFRSVSDVIDTLQELTESPPMNLTGFLNTKEAAALAAEVLAEVVIYTLTIPTDQALSEESFVQLVTRHFERLGITRKSLETLLTTLKLSRQLQH